MRSTTGTSSEFASDGFADGCREQRRHVGPRGLRWGCRGARGRGQWPCLAISSSRECRAACALRFFVCFWSAACIPACCACRRHCDTGYPPSFRTHIAKKGLLELISSWPPRDHDKAASSCCLLAVLASAASQGSLGMSCLTSPRSVSTFCALQR